MISQLPFLPPGFDALSPGSVWEALQEHSKLTVGAAAGLAIVLTVRYLTSPWRRVPPGPPGLPLIGNALQLGGEQWLKYSAWRKEYGMCFLRRVASFVLIYDV